MSGATVRTRRQATLADLETGPENLVAEILDGDLHTSPRPRSRHALAAMRLGRRIGAPFDEGFGGPELRLGDATIVPDLTG
jgi:hypothetical protein